MSTLGQTEKAAIGILVVSALFVLPFLTMGSGMMGAGWGMFGGGMFIWPLVVIGLIALVVYLAGSGSEGGDAEQPDSARAELRERYARGEINDEEFEDRLQLLRDTR